VGERGGRENETVRAAGGTAEQGRVRASEAEGEEVGVAWEGERDREQGGRVYHPTREAGRGSGGWEVGRFSQQSYLHVIIVIGQGHYKKKIN
jgi:hypothetical protein